MSTDDPTAANKAAAGRHLAAALLFVLEELRRVDPDAAEAERARAVRMLGGDHRRAPKPSRVDRAAVARALAEANAKTGLFKKGTDDAIRQD